MVIGTVTDVQSTFWLLDIGAPRWAPLHMTGSPWKIEVGETEAYLRIGDAVVVAVESIENTGRIGVTMVGEGLGKLEGGTIITISPAKVPRVIGRGGSMIQTITHLTNTQIVVGQNGRIWVHDGPDGIARVRAALQEIDAQGHLPGLTERIRALLEASAPQGPITRSEDWTAGVGGSVPSSPSSGPRSLPTDHSLDDAAPTFDEDEPPENNGGSVDA